jgi:hypothetical protein
MKKTPLFILLACISLSVAVFIRARASKLQATFHTAVTVNGIKVYADFTTNIVNCPLYLLTSGGIYKTLFTVRYRVKQAYLICN